MSADIPGEGPRTAGPTPARDDPVDRAGRVDPMADRGARAEVAAQQAARLDAARAREGARARELMAAFVAEAVASGPAPELRATSAGHRATYRTELSGWYVRNDRTMAVGTDGQLYVLSVPRSWSALVRGAALRPVDEPPMVLGAGSRDGESIDLADALRRTLGRDFPTA